MAKVHIGDVILNLYASEDNPHRIGIVNNIDKEYVYMICIYKDKIDKYKFYKSDITNDTEHFIIKGNVNLCEIIKNELDNFK